MSDLPFTVEDGAIFWRGKFHGHPDERPALERLADNLAADPNLAHVRKNLRACLKETATNDDV